MLVQTPDWNSLSLPARYRLEWECVKRRIAQAAMLLTATSIVACTSKIDSPPRPVGVPQSATWAGGADGGAFIDCRVNADASDTCKVYNDFTGQIWMSGIYVLKGQQRGATREELVYLGADGEEIFLANGATLIPSR